MEGEKPVSTQAGGAAYRARDSCQLAAKRHHVSRRRERLHTPGRPGTASPEARKKRSRRRARTPRLMSRVAGGYPLFSFSPSPRFSSASCPAVQSHDATGVTWRRSPEGRPCRACT